MTFIRIYLAVTAVVTALPLIFLSPPAWPSILMGMLSIVFAGAAACV